MNTPPKSTAIFLVIIGTLVLAFLTQAAVHTQDVSRFKNNHRVELTEYDRSSDQKDARIDNLVKMLNVFTGGNPVLVTAYNAHESQTDDTPTITASNEKVIIGGMALSRDFLQVFDRDNPVAYGDTVLLIVPLRVNDTMNARYLNRADVFMWSHKDAVAFGVKEGLVYYD